MHRAYFFVVIFVFTFGLSSTVEFNSGVEDYAKQKVEDAKLSVLRTLENERIHQKAYLNALSELDHRELGHDFLNGVNGLDARSISTWCISPSEDYYLFIIGTTKGDIYVFRYENHTSVLLKSFSTGIFIIKIQAFLSFQNVMLVVHGRSSSGDYLQVFSGLEFKYEQQLFFPDKISFIIFHFRNSIYGAVSRHAGNDGDEPKFLIYQWKGTQFDKIFEKDLKESCAFTVWNMDDVVYISTCSASKIASLLFSYNPFEDASQHFVQHIEVPFSTLVKHFHLHKKHYIVYARQGSADIFLWLGSYFLRWQTFVLDIGEIIDVCLTDVSNIGVLLTFISQDEMSFFVQDSTLQFVHVMKYVPSKKTELFSLLIWLNHMFVPSELLGDQLLQLQHVASSITSQSVEIQPLHACLSTLKDETELLDQKLLAASSMMNRVWLLSDTKSVQAEVVVQGSLNVDKYFKVDNVVIQPSGKEALIHPSDVNNYAVSLIKRSRDMDFHEVVMKSVPQEIWSDISFQSSISATNIEIGVLNYNASINSVFVPELLSALKTQNNGVVSSNVLLDSVTTNDVNLKSGEINGKNLDDVLLLQGEQNVYGSLVFPSLQASDIQIKNEGILNEIALNDVVITNGDQTITDPKTINSLVVGKMDIITPSDNVDFQRYNNSIMFLDTDQFVASELNFTSDISIHTMQEVGAFGNRLSDVMQWGVKKTGDDNIRGQKIFLSPVNAENIFLQGSLNNLETKDFMTTNTQQTFSGNMSFDDVVFDDLILGRLNKINLSKCCMLRKSIIRVRGHKTFSGDLITSNIVMTEGATLDSVDPSKLAQDVVTSDYIMELPNEVFMKDVVVQDVQISAANLPIKELLCCVWLRNAPQFFPYAVVIQNAFFQDIEAEYVNMLDITTDVLLRDSYSVVSSPKTFMNSVTVLESLKTADGVRINDIHLPSLLNSYSQLNYRVLGNVTMKNLFVTGQTDILGTFNGLNFPQDLMLCCNYQEVKSAVFSQVNLDELSAVSITVGRFNNKDLDDFFRNSVMVSGPLHNISNKVFHHLEGSAMHTYGNVDGVNLAQFITRAVSINCSQVMAEKTFTGGLHAEHMTTVDSIYGVNFQTLINAVIYKDMPEQVRGSKKFTNIISVINLNSFGGINGVNLTDLKQNIWSKFGASLFQPMNFLNSIELSNGLVINNGAQLDGVVIQDLVWLNMNEIIFKPFLFNNLRVNGDIHHSGLINGCNLTKVFSEALYLGSTQTQRINPEELLSLIVNGHLTVLSSINGVNVSNLVRKLNAEMQANEYFGDINFRSFHAATLTITHTVNDVTINAIFSDAVFKSNAQEIYGFKKFARISVENIAADDILCHHSLNDVNIQNLFDTSVYISVPQNMEGSFTFPVFNSPTVFLEGVINGISIPEDVILVQTDEIIFGETYFNESVNITSDLMVYGRLDGEQLFTSVSRLVSLHSDQVLYSVITFQEDVYVKGDLVTSGLNGIYFDKMVMLSSHSNVSGNKDFNVLSVAGNMNVATVDSIDLTDLSTNSVQVNEDVHIDDMTFFAPVQVNSLIVVWLNENTAFDVMTYQLITAMNRSTELSADISNKIEQNDAILEHLKEANLYSIFELAYFELHQEIIVPSSLKFLSVHEAGLFNGKPPLPVKHLIMWSVNTQCTSETSCCNIFRSTKFSVHHDGFLDRVRIYPGKFAHFKLGQTKHHVKGFQLRASVLNSNTRCVRRNVTIKTLFSRDFKPSPIVLNVFGDHLVIAKLFEVNNDVFIIIGSSGAYEDYRVALYKYIWDTNQWVKQQNLVYSSPTAMDLYKDSEDSVQLAIGYNATVSLFRWDQHEGIFLYMENITIAGVPSALQWVVIGQDVFLFLARETAIIQSSPSSYIYTDPILVYRFGEKGLVFDQNVEVGGIYALHTFYVFGETYVAAVCRYLQIVYLIQWKGYAGFRVVHDIFAPGVESVTSFQTQTRDVMLAVASTNGHTRILKAAVRGTAVRPVLD